jgi:iron complex transport system ATP-binding protein
MNSVAVANLQVHLGTRDVLRSINLDVAQGDLVAIVGPNGSGKSTLMRTLAGDIAPTNGSVSINGSNVGSLSALEAASVRSFLPQGHAPISHFTVHTIVGFGLYTLDRTDRESAIWTAMERVGVASLAYRPFDELSGGEQRRVSIARVLCQQAPVVLLDEPTDSLDLGHAEMVMATCVGEVSEGRTVITTSHDLNVASRHATKMVLLSDGRIVSSGPPADVLTESLLSEVYETPVTVVEHPRTGLPVVIV